MFHSLKNISTVLIAACSIIVSFPSCISNDSKYNGINHITGFERKYTGIQVDTILIDGSMTSLDGQWLIADTSLYFLDKYSVGVMRYSLDGSFVADCVKAGRGPNELLSPAWISTIDTSDSSFVICDQNSYLWIYNENFTKSTSTFGPWFMQLEPITYQAYWDNLLEFPDPDIPSMYEYNFQCKRIHSNKNQVLLPVITEHIKYNGYDSSCSAKEVWRNSALFIRFDISDISGTRQILGRYPLIYHKKNIPIFATYDYCIDNEEQIIVSFSADSNIYVLDRNGTPLYSFGEKGVDLSLHFTETNTFEDYEMRFESERQKKGYYDRLYLHDSQLIRTYHTDEDEWRMQVYDNKILSGDISVGAKIEILGCISGCYYAFHSVDFENDRFKLIKFTLI